MMRSWVYLFIGLNASGCSTTDNVSTKELKALFTRESTAALESHQTSFSGGLLKIEVRAKTQPRPIESIKLQGIEFDIGSRSPIRCFVSELSLPGTNITNILQNVLQNPKIDSLQEPVGEVSFAGDHPILFLGSYYQTTDKLIGDFKVAHLMLADHSINCTHDEPGYRQTFKKTIRHLASSVEESLPNFTIDKTQIFRVAVDDNAIGFILEQQGSRDGKAIHTSYQSLLLPTKDGAIQTVDSQRSQHLVEGGKIQSAQFVEFLGQDLQYDIKFEYSAKKAYEFSGVFADKAIEKAVASEMLATEETQVQKAIAAKQQNFQMQTFLPNTAPDKFSTAKVSLDQGLRSGVMAWSDQSVRFKLDENLDLIEQIIPQGDVVVKVERLN